MRGLSSLRSRLATSAHEASKWRAPQPPNRAAQRLLRRAAVGVPHGLALAREALNDDRLGMAEGAQALLSIYSADAARLDAAERGFERAVGDARIVDTHGARLELAREPQGL